MGWWRRNALALGGLVVAVGMVGASWYLTVWLPHAPVSAPIISVDADARTDVGGLTFSALESAVEDDAEGFYDAPEGTRVVAAAVTVDVDPDLIGTEDAPKTQPSCTVLLTEKNAPQRTWKPTPDITLSRTLYSSDCSSSLGSEYRVIAPFLIPDDATGPFYVDIFVTDVPTGNETLRYTIAP